MSWSNFVYDVNTPAVTATLTTLALQLDPPGGQQTPGSSTCDFKQCAHGLCKVNGPAECDDVLQYDTSCPPNKVMLDINIDVPNATDSCTDRAGTYFTICRFPTTYTCAGLNGSATCSLGQATGNCPNNSCIYQQTWQSVPLQPHAFENGWTICSYNFDYTLYNHAGAGPSGVGPVSLANWVNDLYSAHSAAAPGGFHPVAKNRVRDAHFVYASLYDFYNQLYNTGYYQGNPSVNQFFNIDYLNTTMQSMDQFTKGVLDRLKILLTPSYPNGFPQDLYDNVYAVLQLPQPNLTNDQYTVTFNLTYSQYQLYKGVGDQGALLANYLNAILRDNQSNMTNQITGQSWQPMGMSFKSNPTVNSITALQLVDVNGNPAYIKTTGIDPNTFTSAAYPGYIFGVISVTATVDVWSPMLVIYFQALNSLITFSPQTCQAIALHSGSGSNYPSTIPGACFIQDCADPVKCKQDMTNFCSIFYSPPNYLSRVTTDKFLVSRNYPGCYCFTSTLPPAIDQTPGNPAAMCFDTSCTPALRGMFNLDDVTCKNYCSTVWDWMTSADPAKQSANKESFDSVRFSQLCGQEFQPYTPTQVNWSVGAAGGAATILVALLSYSLCQHYNIGAGKTTLIIIGVTIILVGLAVFLARDMAGIAICNGREMVCQSRITNRTIPNQFCNYTLNCECQLDSDCGSSNCKCASSTCFPVTGTRPTATVKVRQANIPFLIVSVIVILALPISLIYSYRDHHWNIPRPIFYGLVGLTALLPLGYILYTTLKKVDRLVFTGSCAAVNTNVCSPPCGAGQVCYRNSCCQPGRCQSGGRCDSSTSDGCGTSPCVCPDGQKCFNGRCCTPTTTCSGQECGEGSDGCGGACNCPNGQTCNFGMCMAPCPPDSCNIDCVCPSGQQCVNGRCQTLCAYNGACAGCVCPDGQICIQGRCKGM